VLSAAAQPPRGDPSGAAPVAPIMALTSR